MKISLALWDLHAVDIPDDEMDHRETVGDVVRSMVAHAERQSCESPLTEDEALPKIRRLIADELQVSPEQVTVDALLFSAPLRLDSLGKFHR
ncbi:hypothetical protein [Fimbriiglobus ruber]|uniref:Uncharacterized protein n=1 Tax=Fimbriiglobus ruber TaxID=1908690 RepID=A0A225D3I7_9BACT|nr:hypothetical protein [Fimbriiglobus ruber]OWK36072.1 hypothetical protein FRUB_08635 [Fimbriiglobus ruber]